MDQKPASKNTRNWRKHTVILLIGAAIIAIFIFVFSPSKDSSVLYEVTFLGSLDGDDTLTHATCLNNNSQVSGYSEAGEREWHGFVWDASSGMNDIGSLGGRWTQPQDINDKGWIVGHEYVEEDVNHAFLWTEADGMVDLGTFGGKESYAFGLNNDGIIVGKAQEQDGTWRACVWDEGKEIRKLEAPGSSESSANAINEAGLIAGHIRTSTGSSHAVLWNPEGELRDIGGFGGWRIYPVDINNSGMVLVEAEPDPYVTGEFRAFIWTSGEGFMEIEGFGGELTRGWALNNHGQMVGAGEGWWELPSLRVENYVVKSFSMISEGLGELADRFLGGTGAVAFLWEEGNLTRLTNRMTENTDRIDPFPKDINDQGQIVGWSYSSGGGKSGAILLTPVLN